MRRAVEALLAGAAGVALSPVLAVLALLVRRRLGSPVLFRQDRSGLAGETFRIVKFRTMRDPAYPEEPDADRTPPFGEQLRRYSLDELPQLWNVVRGDMGIVGPRPTLPEQVVHYDERQRGRLSVRPGLTGWAQINGRNALSWPERIELDLEYIARRSLLLDARIVAVTMLRLLRPAGVTGEGGVNPGFPLPSDAAPQPTPAGEPPAASSA